MEEFLEIHWTSGSLDEARKICRYLTQERLVACCQIIPWIESIYMLNNQLETAQESKIIFKAPERNYKKIQEVIQTNCSYEVPEMLTFKISGGNPEYLSWLSEATPEAFKSHSVIPSSSIEA